MRRHQRGALSALRVTGVSLLHDVKTSNRLLRDASRKQRNCCSLCLDALNELPAVSHQGAGGARRDRTDDLMLAKHALSQLSYGPWDALAGSAIGLGPNPSRRPTVHWWAWKDLNFRPHAYQARALTN
jgi:hypothetical protein